MTQHTPTIDQLKTALTSIYRATKPNRDGHMPSYIPELANINPDHFAISICTVNGERFDIGDYTSPYSIQSTFKPISYCLASEELGSEVYHQFVGREPSGRGFNELTLNHENRPHNPMINAGAILTCALIKSDIDTHTKWEYILDQWQGFTGGTRPILNTAIYKSEKTTADRNFALAYFMRENKAFPKNTHFYDILKLYFKCCSLELTTNAHAVVAATLANGGINPITGKQLIDPMTAKNCLSLMYSCGLYDFSGEFAFTVGLPAKSGVSGALMVVIPGKMGIVIWSPKLDKYGNSVRGIEVCQRLTETFKFHLFD